MKIEQARKLVILLSKEWKIDPFFSLNKITNELNGSICQPYSDFNTFEFPLVSFEKSVKFLHLNFYKPDVSYDKVKILGEKRTRAITSILKYINKKSGFKYNFWILKCVASVIKDTSWPVQFGYEACKDKPPVIKIYISVARNNSNSCFLKKLCDVSGFRWRKLEKIFSRNRIDSVGFDLLHNGLHRLKIYTYFEPPFDLLNMRKIYKEYNKSQDKYLDSYLKWIKNMPLRHVGLLYRISEDSSVGSVKIWARLEKPAPFKLLRPIIKPAPARLSRWLISACDIIKSARAKVAYLTLENGKIGVYFR